MAGLPLPDPSKWGNFLPGMAEGRQMMGQLMQNELAQKKLEQNKYSGLTGIANEVLSLDKLKQMLPGGEENPVYKRAKAAFEQDQKRVAENIKSSEFYRKNPWRLYDPTTKAIHAEHQASQGNYPEGTPAYTPGQSEEVVNTYEKERFNKGTPQFLQQQYEAAQQIDETIKLIDPNKAFPYSGVTGQVELWKDRYEAQKNGKPSEKLLQFEEQETYLHNLREQIRSYLGSSITAGMTKDLDYLVNPSNWMNHPEIAKRKYEAVLKAYENEKKVTERAIKYGNPSAPQPLFAPQQNQEGTQSLASYIGITPEQSEGKEVVTKESILNASKKQKWPKEKEQAALKHYGFA